MWRVLLLSDRSVTRHLSVLGAGNAPTWRFRWRAARDDDDDEANETSTSGRRPRDASLLRGNVVRREVFARGGGDGDGRRTGGVRGVVVEQDSMRDFMPDANASM